jgi:hypothetical protein
MQSFDFGIMPLEDSNWVKGKCEFKNALLCIVRMPTIASPFGMSEDILVLGRLEIGC